MRAMAQTSLITYDTIKPSLNHRQTEVLHAIEILGGSATMHKVAIKMFRPLHTISGRFSELVKKGYITKIGVEEAVKGHPPRTIYGLTGFPANLTERCRALNAPARGYAVSGSGSVSQQRGGK